MKKAQAFISLVLRDYRFYLPLFLSVIFNALIWFLILWRLPAQTAWIPLHYTVAFGIDWFGPWNKILYYPLISLAIIIINLFLAAQVHDRNSFQSIFLIWTALILQIIILINLIVLILNFFS
ncbi:MAG: hypothetical protein COU22_00700 [Candidatus Komeilibacteria bacterium CG10_big_fil_rev_8_21_14_0_10_41_13]|uniref:DUF1648 domain-containing protein n=1 Tax=Candidatus Komeilibacteria bacterium CG10_big_fil_rev_8_21_14_0_10_41_13 TaxID=1974476 RepID=A0A2M6WD51_9BACT|nr:MAG: hypothetical protein COU22_00700 [Candidatus Komeilibacteria bacterium CG10_big_fil_rev_8_21_14_0_10_41_13]